MNDIIFIAADHRGFQLKAKVTAWMKSEGYTVQDLGTNSEDRCDAGDFANIMAKEMGAGKGHRGVLICGTGQAMAMTANRYRAIRAALCAEPTTARLTRQHNDANVLVLGADIVGHEIAMDCLKVFLTTPFLGGRYAERLEKLKAMGGL